MQALPIGDVVSRLNPQSTDRGSADGSAASNRRRPARWLVPAAAALLVGLQVAGASSAFAGRADNIWHNRTGKFTVLERQCKADGGVGLISIRDAGEGKVTADCKSP